MSREANELDWSALGDSTDEAVIIANQGQSTEPWYTSVLRTTLPVLASTYQQQQLTKLNISRMSQGLPPLTAQDYAANYMVPAAQVQVGPTAEAQKLLMYGGLALLGYLGLRAVSRRR